MDTLPNQEYWRNPEVLEWHASQYYSDLPYHNWEHATSVRDRCRELAMVCFTQGLTVDLEVLEAAALYHDAGYHQRQEQYGVGTAAMAWTKEKYSQYLAATDLQALGMPNEKIAQVLSCIASTQADIDCTSIEGKILAQADIENVGGDPMVFMKNTLKLYKETGMLAVSEKVPSLVEYAHKSHKYLQLFLAKDLSLGNFDIDPESGRSWLCSRGIKNNMLLIEPRRRILRWFQAAADNEHS